MIGIKEALLYAKMPQHNALVRKTEGFIRWALARVENPYVACSFGKDSSAMLHLVLKARPGTPVLYAEYEESDLIDNYKEVIEQWDIDLHRIFIPCDIDEEVNEKDIIPRYALANGFDSGFVGIRANESKGRNFSLKKNGMFYTAQNGITRICPLKDWTLLDSAAYCVLNNLPLLQTYINYGFEERTVNSFSNDDYSFRENQLRHIKNTDVSRFNQLIYKYPKLSRYA